MSRRPRRVSRCCCRRCVADSLEVALFRLAKGDPLTAARIVMVCVEDLRLRAPILDAVPQDHAHMERRQ